MASNYFTNSSEFVGTFAYVHASDILLEFIDPPGPTVIDGH